MKKGLSFQLKLIIVLLLCVVVPVVTIALLAYNNSSQALKQKAIDQLEAVRDTKKDWLGEVFDSSLEPGAHMAMDSYEAGELFGKLMDYASEKNIKPESSFDVTSPEYKEIANPYDQHFEDILDRFGFTDVYLISGKYGQVMYATSDGKDLGTNLSVGPYRDSQLAKVWKDVMTSQQLSFADYAPYEPTGGTPAAFIGVPMDINGEIEGVLAVRIPEKHMNEVMSVKSGMGETGGTYLVGPDKLMRSDCDLDHIDMTVAQSFADPEKGQVHSVSVDKALAGETGQGIITDRDGNLVLSAYTPVNILGVHWALIAEIDEVEAFASVYTLRELMIIISAAVILIVSLIGFFFSRSIAKPLNLVSDSLNSSSMQIASAANQLSNTSQDLANGASEQASSIEETTASMEELGAMVRQNVENAKQMNVLAVKSSESSDTGSRQMKELLQSMEELNSSSDEIKKIIKVIDNIAFQTNILALNAAVEAARAGEAGLGFAVVADEVKNLANKSADAASETSELIEDSLKKIGKGLDVTRELSSVFEDIQVGGQKVTEMSREVETASTQQDVGISQINEVVVQLDKVVQSNASAAEESASSAEELAAQSETLRGIVRQLVRIITGKTEIGNGGKTGENPPVRQIAERKTRTASHGEETRVQLYHKPSKEVRPEEVIPFEEDDEFTDL